MDVFSLRDSVIGDYCKFVTSFTTIHAGDRAHHSKRANIELNEAFAKSTRTGTSDQTRIDSPSTDSQRCHPPRP